MYGNYGREDQYGGRPMYDYPPQQPNHGYSQAQQYDGQQQWGGNRPNSGRPGGPPANMASPWDERGGPPSQGDMMSRNYHQLGQSRQSSYHAPHDNNHPNALPDDKAARAYEFLANVNEDQKRKDELEEQKREVQRLRDEVKKSMETLQHLQGGVGDRDGGIPGIGGGWPAAQQQQQPNKGPVKSILKKPKALGSQEEDEQPRTNYCDVCSIQFNSTREYQQHCAGLLHTKQLMQKKMGISIDKEKSDDPGLMQGRQGQPWVGGNQRGSMANPPVDLNAIYSAFEDYEEDEGKAQVSQNKPQYVEGGNVHCKICGCTFYTNEEMRSHSATEEHCRKYLSLHNALGTDKFLAKYGENIFGMAVKYIAAMVDRHIRTDLSGRDLKYYKEFITRSGVVNAYQCRICQASTFMMEHWIAHCAGKKHTRACMTKMLSMSSEAYLEEFGDVPGPAPSKSIDSRMIPKWESVFILEALKAVPKMSLIQEQQVADNLQHSRQQPGPQHPPYGMSPQGMNPQGMNPMDRNQPGAPYQQGRNQPPGGNPPGNPQQTPPSKGLLGDSPGILEQLQARYEQQKKAQAMSEAKGPDYGHPKGASPSAQAFDQQDRGGYGPPRDSRGDFRDQRGPHPLPGRQPGPPHMDPYNRPPPHQDRGYDMDPRHADEHSAAPYENPFNQAPPHRNAPDMYGQMHPPRPHPSDRFERDRNIPGLQPGQRPPFDQGREPRHDNQGREPRHDNQGREPRHDNQGREPRHDNQGREPRHDNQGRGPRHDNQDREPRHDSQGRDREYGRDDRRNSSHDRSRDRPSNDRPSHDRSSNDRSSRDNKEKPAQSNTMYDPFESEPPGAAAPAAAAGGGDKGVVPTAKALQMLHQIQEKQRMEQEKLEKQLKEQQRMLDKQKKEMERERQKHQQELEKREKALKEKQQKLEDEKKAEERKRKEKEKELEKERNLRLEEKRRQLQMKDDLERKRLQRQREELERKRQEKTKQDEDRKKKDEEEKRDEILKQQKLKEELQRKVQEEMETKRQERLKKEIEERVKQAELQKLKDKEMELERLVNAKKMELQQNNSGRQQQGRGRGAWRPVNAQGQFTPAAMPVGRNPPIPSHLIAVPRSMVGTHMGMRPSYPASMAGTVMPPGVPVTSVPGQQGLIHGAPWHVPPPVVPQANQAPWNKATPAPKTQPQTAKTTPTSGAPPPWSAAKAGNQAEAGKKPQGKTDTKSSDAKADMPWKRKDDKAKESADVPWKRKDERSQDSSRDMPWKRKDKEESSRDRSSHRDDKRDSRGSSRDRDSTRSRDAPWQSDRSRDRSRDQRSSEEDRSRSSTRRTPPNLRTEAPWHSKKDDKTAPWESSGRRTEGEGMSQDAPWASRRGPGGRPNVEKGHTYKLVLTERDQHSWKVAQADFIQCMDSGENTARPLKVFTNTLQSHMRRIQEAKDQLPESEILATLSSEEQVVTKQIQQMTGLEPIAVVTCTLHLLQAMDPRVFNILGTMDPNFMQSLISDAMAGGGRDDRGSDRAGDRRRSRSRSPPRRDRDSRDSRDAPPWLRGVKRPTDQPDSDKRSRWA